MKFNDLYGKEHRKEICYKTYKKDESSRSNLANFLYKKIKEIFPNNEVLEEFPCVGLNPILYIDFLILSPALRIAFEADGAQHNKFTPFFHGDKRGFANARINDLNKERWLKVNNIKLIRISDEKELDSLVEKINESYNRQDD